MGAVRRYLILSVFKVIGDVPDLTREPFGQSAMPQSINHPDCEEEPTAFYVIHHRHILHTIRIHLVHQKIQKSRMVGVFFFLPSETLKNTPKPKQKPIKKEHLQILFPSTSTGTNTGFVVSFIHTCTEWLKPCNNYLFRGIGIPLEKSFECHSQINSPMQATSCMFLRLNF